MKPKGLLKALGILVAFFLFLFVAYVQANNKWDKVEMMTESDGSRQLDHKYLAIFPLSESVKAPELHVTQDGFAELNASGLKNLPEVFTSNKDRWVNREIYGSKVEYVFSIPIKKTASEVLSFYCKQLKEYKGLTKPPSMVSVNGTCPDGKHHIEVSPDPSSSRFLLKLSK